MYRHKSKALENFCKGHLNVDHTLLRAVVVIAMLKLHSRTTERGKSPLSAPQVTGKFNYKSSAIQFAALT